MGALRQQALQIQQEVLVILLPHLHHKVTTAGLVYLAPQITAVVVVAVQVLLGLLAHLRLAVMVVRELLLPFQVLPLHIPAVVAVQRMVVVQQV